MPLLSVAKLSIHFGGLAALINCSFDVEQGKIFSLIGPNGAGKTTVFNIINGIYKADRGKILFDGTDITHLAPHNVARLGVARTFQNIELFSKMTVLENVLVGQHIHLCSGILSGGLLLGRVRAEEKLAREEANNIFDFLGLTDYRSHLVSDLPHGIQTRVEMARALAAKPKILLLDEPAGGLNPQETQVLMQLIERIRSDLKITVLLVEHDMAVVMGLSDRICVLHFGQKIAEGSPGEIQKHPRVTEAYLGETVEHA
ncbi:MAG: ABC transporter ATP-binding protein [Desulfomonile tiedjei]|uniref:ABC transporter ATP-binding protein n=1 Tax=Desulfomonile tiedjei TaxID=2358 RepID=A0A9D6V005_9BACT|nr:ABC transporter ATP-binding protein [Desulfomonile tiedjei]